MGPLIFTNLIKAGHARNPRNKETLTARSPMLNGCAYTSCIQLGKKTHLRRPVKHLLRRNVFSVVSRPLKGLLSPIKRPSVKRKYYPDRGFAVVTMSAVEHRFFFSTFFSGLFSILRANIIIATLYLNSKGTGSFAAERPAMLGFEFGKSACPRWPRQK